MKTSRRTSLVLITSASLLAASGILFLLLNLTVNGKYLLPGPKPVSASNLDLPGGVSASVSEAVQQLEDRNIASGFSQADPSQLTADSLSDRSMIGLVDELLEVTRGFRLVNTLHLDEIKSEFDKIENIGSDSVPADNYDNSDRVQQAMLQAWNANYPNFSSFDRMLMPLDMTDIQDASQFSIDILTHPIRLDSMNPEIIQIFNPHELEGKNWLEIVFNTHGFDMPFGENAILGVEQPMWGDLHYTNLSFYATPGSFDEQIAYIPISELYQGGGPLNLENPTGSLRIRIRVDPGYGVDIARVTAFYLAP